MTRLIMLALAVFFLAGCAAKGKSDVPAMIIELETEMKKEANALNFERAIELRDKILKLKEMT